MFNFLKKKLKNAVDKFTGKIDEEGKEDVIEQPLDLDATDSEKKDTTKESSEKDRTSKEDKKESKKEVNTEKELESEKKVREKEALLEKRADPDTETFENKERQELKLQDVADKQGQKESKEGIDNAQKLDSDKKTTDTLSKKGKKKEELIKKIKEEPVVETTPEKKEKKGFFSRITEKITTKKITAEQFQDLFWELEVVLLENNVAVEVIEKIKADLSAELVDTPLPRSKVQQKILDTLQRSVRELFFVPKIDIVKLAEQKKPLVICLVGINGAGKTTTIAKLTKFLKDNDKSVVIAASDTFRAAAIDQLQIHADNLGVKLIKHDYGSDAAAVAFDAINHARAKDKDVVLIDTAGRLHSNHNLVDEMKKIVRVAQPDLNIFIGESITGNDCVEQAVKFDEAIGLHGIILSKADIDEKGGAAISVSYVTKKPILYLGVGQEYKDLVPFNPDEMVEKLFA
ncbi:signal recognition particle-docking protein FtsY [Candidatus Woesearchaeota archaeon]|nr:signal recognition particle-docking protein FtsY [Candidatus Woesearchaeota archaeon]